MAEKTARELIEAAKRGVQYGFPAVILRDRAASAFERMLEALEIAESTRRTFIQWKRTGQFDLDAMHSWLDNVLEPKLRAARSAADGKEEKGGS